jgi:glycosyltransferase involved in cell wall biosynthesis
VSGAAATAPTRARSQPARERPRVAYLRGSYLNPFEAQYLELLSDRFAVTLAHPRSHRYDLSGIDLPRRALPCLDYLNGLLPRRLLGRTVSNPLKFLGFDEVLLGLDPLLGDSAVVHVPEQTFYFTWQVARRKERHGFRLVTTQDEVNPFWYDRRKGMLARARQVRAATDLFLARSERAAAALVVEGVPPGRIRVVGHGIDTARFHPGPGDGELQARLGIAPGRFVILVVARLVWTKGLWAIADAIAALLRDPAFAALDPLVVIAGEGGERGAFLRRLALLGLSERFRLLGDQPYALLPAIHRLADLFLMPSITTRTVLEQFGIALIEAMATAVPVISTHAGAIDEVVGDAGLLVQPNDSFRLAEAIRALALDPARRRSLGEAGRAHVLAHFRRELIAERLAAAYDEVLGAAPA